MLNISSTKIQPMSAYTLQVNAMDSLALLKARDMDPQFLPSGSPFHCQYVAVLADGRVIMERWRDQIPADAVQIIEVPAGTRGLAVWRILRAHLDEIAELILTGTPSAVLRMALEIEHYGGELTGHDVVHLMSDNDHYLAVLERSQFIESLRYEREVRAYAASSLAGDGIVEDSGDMLYMWDPALMESYAVEMWRAHKRDRSTARSRSRR